MRRRMLLVLVILLCLRGWVGEAMAGQMLGQQLQVAQAAAAMPDCPGHAAMAAAGEESDSSCGSCLQCQACSLHALPAAAPVLRARGVTAAPPAPPQSFVSAEPVRGFKPPSA